MIILLTENNSFIFICVHICEYTAPLCVKNASKNSFFKDKKIKNAVVQKFPF